jgi:hypothetical protein
MIVIIIIITIILLITIIILITMMIMITAVCVRMCLCLCVFSASDKAHPSAPALTCAFWLVGTWEAAVSARSWSLTRAFATFRRSPMVVQLCKSLSFRYCFHDRLFITLLLLCRTSACNLNSVVLCPLPIKCGPANLCLPPTLRCATLGSNSSVCPAAITLNHNIIY